MYNELAFNITTIVHVQLRMLACIWLLWYMDHVAISIIFSLITNDLFLLKVPGTFHHLLAITLDVIWSSYWIQQDLNIHRIGSSWMICGMPWNKSIRTQVFRILQYLTSIWGMLCSFSNIQQNNKIVHVVQCFYLLINILPWLSIILVFYCRWWR